MENQLLSQLASTGIVGVLLVIALYTLRTKDRELKAEMQLRIEDAQKFNTLAMSLQKEVIQSVSRLGEIVEWAEKRIDDGRKRGEP
jgi:hypothetical protein